MRTNSPSLAFLTFTLSLYAAALTASTAHAEPMPVPEGQGRQLSDQNLFEVHLQRPASSQRRLPSEILKDLHERDEVVAEAEQATVTAAPVASTSASLAALPSTAPASSSTVTAQAVEITYTPRQPSHFIRHRRNRGDKPHGKRRLGSSEPATVTIARDTDELTSLWEIPEIVARAMEAYGATSATGSSTSAHEQDETESTPADFVEQQRL